VNSKQMATCRAKLAEFDEEAADEFVRLCEQSEAGYRYGKQQMKMAWSIYHEYIPKREAGKPTQPVIPPRMKPLVETLAARMASDGRWATQLCEDREERLAAVRKFAQKDITESLAERVFSRALHESAFVDVA
jgi:hypothetical protein